MKLATLMIFLAVLAAPVLAQPTYELDGSVLTVTGAELAMVDGPDARLVAGFPVPAVDAAVGFDAGQGLIWELAPGVYTVTVLGPNAAGVAGDETVWTITVDAPPPPTRIEQIRAAWFAMVEVTLRWQALAPTGNEIVRAVMMGPPAHPTPAVRETGTP